MASKRTPSSKSRTRTNADEAFRLLFLNHPIPMWVYDQKTLAFLAVNDAALAKYGYSRSAFLQMTLLDIRPKEEVPQLMASVTQDRPPLRASTERRHRLKDGTLIDVEITSHAIEFNGRQAALVMVQDITERKRAEEALRASEASLVMAQRVARMGSWERDHDFATGKWSTGRWSDELFRLMGRDPSAGTPSFEEFLQLLHPDDRHLLVQASTQASATDGGPATEEFRSSPDHGPVRYFVSNVQVTRDAQGRIPKVVGTVQDVTERKQAEEALRQAQERLQRVATAGKVGLWEWDMSTNRVFYSPGWKRLIGYEDHEITDDFSEWKNRIHPDDLQRCLQSMQEHLANRSPNFRLDYRFRHKDGSYRWMTGAASLLFDEQGNPTYMLGSEVDVTDLKEMEAEKEALATQYYQMQKMDSIGRLAGGIAHDFNNMLVPIIGYAELGMRALGADSRLYDYLQQIKQSGERAANLTRQILAFSRQQVLEMKVLDLNQLVVDFQPMLRRLLGEHIDLQTRLADDLPAIKGDKGQIEQVILNLVVNARDAMPNGGTLITETAEVLLDDTYVAKNREARPGPHVMLAVSDTGIGMDASTRERIFEPFFTTKPAGQGTGLGLSTVFGIVKQHEGDVTVYSEPGRGTTFKVYLPLAETPAAVSSAQGPVSSLLSGTETVLLVEDEATVRRLTGDALRAHGYLVLEASGGEEGLATAAAHPGPIHLLLTDVIMPGMDGQELHERLAPLRDGLKVLYMSGYASDLVARHGVLLLSKSAAFLQKPFAIDTLLQKVRSVLG